MSSKPSRLPSYFPFLDFQEDYNSPLSISDTDSGTIDLADEYDVVLCILNHTENVTSNPVTLRVNGDSGGNYDYIIPDGTKTTGATEVDLTGYDAMLPGTVMWMTGKWENRWIMRKPPMRAFNGRAVAASNQNISSPLDSITLVNTAGDPFYAEMEVYGK